MQQDSDKNKFVCPNCGKKEEIKNASVRSVTILSESNLTFQGNRYRDTIREKYCSIRFCHSCNRKLIFFRIFRHTAILLLPTILMLIFGEHGNIIVLVGFGIFISLAIYIPSVKVYREIKSKSKGTHALIQKAIGGNAIVK